MSIFEVMGPIMIGPSSSHTAGAVKIGRIARLAFADNIERADIFLHGSFAETYRGHGTDRALTGGLLGFQFADERIKNSLEIAEKQGMEVHFRNINLRKAHPNTVLLELSNKDRLLRITCSSIGGANIRVQQIDGYEIDISGNYPTIWVLHQDRPGITGLVTSILGSYGLNIAFMKVFRKKRGQTASSIIELDDEIKPGIIESLNQEQRVIQTRYLPPL